MPIFTANLDGVELEVEYEIEPAQRGSCDSMGVPEEPSWPAHVDYVEYYGLDEDYLSEKAKKEIKKQADKHFEELR